MPHRVEFKPQRIRHPGAVFAVRLVEQRTLTELNVLLRITEVSGDVGDEMRFILVAEHTAVKFAGLLEVDVLRIDVVARDTARDVDRGRRERLAGPPANSRPSSSLSGDGPMPGTKFAGLKAASPTFWK